MEIREVGLSEYRVRMPTNKKKEWLSKAEGDGFKQGEQGNKSRKIIIHNYLLFTKRNY